MEKVQIPKRFKKLLAERFPPKSKVCNGMVITKSCPLCDEFFRCPDSITLDGPRFGCTECPFKKYSAGRFGFGCYRFIEKVNKSGNYCGFVIGDMLTITNTEKYLKFRKKAMRFIEWV